MEKFSDLKNPSLEELREPQFDAWVASLPRIGRIDPVTGHVILPAEEYDPEDDIYEDM